VKKKKLKIGQALGGGFYVGNISDSGVEYHLIVAPKTEGEAVKKWMDCTTGANSCTDGAANTSAILQTVITFPAAQFCADLRIGGFDDWYLPSKDELNAAWKANKALADIGEAFADYNFWSSSEYSAPYAWYQFFYSGYPGNQITTTKTSGDYVRAFRRLII
jgi:hypothetical protein